MMNEERWHGTSGEGTAKRQEFNSNQESANPRRRPRIQRATASAQRVSGSQNRNNDGAYGARSYRASGSDNMTRGERRPFAGKPSYQREGDNRFGGRNNRNNGTRGGYGNRYRANTDTYQTLNDGLRFRNQDDSMRNERRPFQRKNGNVDPNARSFKKQQEYKPREVDLTKPVRLNKFLANAGICSRREADEYIQAGVITVNGQVVSELGAKVMLTDVVKFHDQVIRSERKVYLLLNKPKNCVTTTEDTHERTTVLDLVKNACSERIYPVGRLDRNTTGVLLLTNDGDLASKLTHPKFEKKKIYHATLDKPLDIEAYQTIMGGIELDGEVIRPDELEFTSDDDRAQVGIEIHSGQNRVVRRIFEKVGYKVVKLDRVFFAGLTKKNLPRGKYRFLTQREVNMLLMGAFE